MEILTERRTPMPVKSTPTGGYAFEINIRLQILGTLGTYKANEPADGCRKRIEEIYSWIQPRCKFVTATLGLTGLKHLRSK